MSELNLTRDDLNTYICAIVSQCLDHPNENIGGILREKAHKIQEFLKSHQGEQTFILCSERQMTTLQFTGFVANGTLELEQRIANLEARLQIWRDKP